MVQFPSPPPLSTYFSYPTGERGSYLWRCVGVPPKRCMFGLQLYLIYMNYNISLAAVAPSLSFPSCGQQFELVLPLGGVKRRERSPLCDELHRRLSETQAHGTARPEISSPLTHLAFYVNKISANDRPMNQIKQAMFI